MLSVETAEMEALFEFFFVYLRGSVLATLIIKKEATS
jgi:hypothetical protein